MCRPLLVLQRNPTPVELLGTAGLAVCDRRCPQIGSSRAGRLPRTVECRRDRWDHRHVAPRPAQPHPGWRRRGGRPGCRVHRRGGWQFWKLAGLGDGQLRRRCWLEGPAHRKSQWGRARLRTRGGCSHYGAEPRVREAWAGDGQRKLTRQTSTAAVPTAGLPFCSPARLPFNTQRPCKGRPASKLQRNHQ